MRSATSDKRGQRIRRLMPGFEQSELASRVWFPGFSLVTGVMTFGRLLLILFVTSSDLPLFADQIHPEKKAGAEQPKNDGGKQVVSQKYIAQLTPKLSVELIAVTMPEFTEDADDSKPANADQHRWWRPDGTPLEEVPAAPAGKKVSLRTTRGGELIREFLIRIEGLDHPHSLWGVVVHGGRGFTDEGNDSKQGAVVVRLSDKGSIDALSTNLVIGLAHEDWGPTQKMTPDAKLIDPVKPPEDYRILYDEFRPRRHNDGDQRTSFSFNTLSDFWGPIIDYRMEGFDLGGVSHAFKTDPPRDNSIARSQIRLKQVAHVEYKLRPFRHKVTFGNISLASSHNTLVDIETVTLDDDMRAWPSKPAPQKQEENERSFNDFRVVQAQDSLTEINCVDLPLRETLEYLVDLHKITIELDATAIEFRENLDIQGVTLNLKNRSLRDALMLILYPLNLSYIVQDGKLVITTPHEVRRRGAELPLDFNTLLAKLSAYPMVNWEVILRGENEDADAVTISNLELALLDKDPAVQLQAATAAYCVAKSAKSSIPQLKKLTIVNNWRVRDAAYKALAAIGSDDLSTLSLLINAWPKDEVVRYGFAEFISEFDERAAAELAKYYPSGSPEFRLAILHSVRGRAKSAEKLVLLGLADADERMRRFSFVLSTELENSSDAIDEALRNYSKSEGVPIK
jgi:hypothetical protein